MSAVALSFYVLLLAASSQWK